MFRHRICLRLLEATNVQVVDASRLSSVRGAVEKLGPIEWEMPPAIDPRGGYRMSFYLLGPRDYDKWEELLEQEGYRAVM